MYLSPSARARDKLGSMSSDIQDDSVQIPFESPTAGIIEFANRDRTAPDSVTPGGSAWPGVIAKSTDNGGSPFTGDKVTDAYVPSMLAAANFVEGEFGAFGGNAVTWVSAQSSAAIVVHPNRRVYEVDLSDGTETAELSLDVSGVSGAFEIDVWVSPPVGGLTYPAGVLMFDGAPAGVQVSVSGKRYLFRFTRLAEDGAVYGRYVGAVTIE